MLLQPVVNVESDLLERPVDGIRFDDVIDELEVGVVVEVLGADRHPTQSLEVFRRRISELLGGAESVDQSRLTARSVVILTGGQRIGSQDRGTKN